MLIQALRFWRFVRSFVSATPTPLPYADRQLEYILERLRAFIDFIKEFEGSVFLWCVAESDWARLASEADGWKAKAEANVITAAEVDEYCSVVEQMRLCTEEMKKFREKLDLASLFPRMTRAACGREIDQYVPSEGRGGLLRMLPACIKLARTVRAGTTRPDGSVPAEILSVLHELRRPYEELEQTVLMRLSKDTPPTPDVPHSVDFRSMMWSGKPHSFTANQAQVVKVLYENWKRGTPDVGDATLLQAVDHDAPPARLNVLFRDHPAWDAMIVAGRTRGTHRLAEPIRDFAGAREDHQQARA